MDKVFDHASFEEICYEKWQKAAAFKTVPSEDKPPYVIMMPPPNVTGSLHQGHALTYTIQDILIRYMRMQGHDVLWQPGTDHGGIATQLMVERQLKQEGKTRQELGRDAFLERVWAWKEYSSQTIVSQQKRLGISPDWERSRFTMDDGLSHAVLKAFVDLYNDGLIYKDKRLVNWDPTLQTALSDLEVIQTEQEGTFWYVKYPLVGLAGEYIVVATTRPETMFGDMAVAVHPDDERYKHLIGQMVKLPLTERAIPIIGDEHCDPTLGTGAVKITPAHDFNDFEVGKRHQLLCLNIMDTKGHLNEQVPEGFRGMNETQARQLVLEQLEEKGLIEKTETKRNVIPLSEKSGAIIQPYLTDQWYLKADILAKPAIDVVKNGRVRFVPSQWTNNYLDWLENIQPWCISRQLWWGHQIPAWYGPDQTIFVAMTKEEAEEKAFQHYGEKKQIIQDPDVLDTWFSSALWPFSTLGWPEKTPDLSRYYPTSVLVTGFDIIFFWVARMIMMGMYFTKDIPYKDVYIHALVRDEKGQKMSKTKGNVIDPLDVIAKYGADSLRYCLSSMAVPGRDVRMGEQKIASCRNFITKIWNAARFLDMNECRIQKNSNGADPQHPINLWIAEEFDKALAKVESAMTQYRFDDASQEVYHFFWSIFCDEYLEYAKTLFQTEYAAETRKVAGEALGRALHMMNPFIPFVTEKLWTELGGEDDLIVRSWPKPFRWPGNIESVQSLRHIIQQARSLRGILGVQPSLVGHIDGLGECRPEFWAILSQMVKLKPKETVNGIPFLMDGRKVEVDFEGNYGPAEVLGILEKKKTAIAIEIERLQKKLDNIAYKDAKPDQYQIDVQLCQDRSCDLKELNYIIDNINK